SYTGIANVNCKQGDYTRALEAHQKALEIRRAVLGERHPNVAGSYNDIAVVYSDQGDYTRALEAHQKALEIRRAVWGERHPDVAGSCYNIALVYRDQSDYTRALDSLDQSLGALGTVADLPASPDAAWDGSRIRPLPLTVDVLQV